MFGLKQNQKAYPLSKYKRHVLELSISDGLREGRPFLSPKETVLVVKPVLAVLPNASRICAHLSYK